MRGPVNIHYTQMYTLKSRAKSVQQIHYKLGTKNRHNKSIEQSRTINVMQDLKDFSLKTFNQLLVVTVQIHNETEAPLEFYE